MVVSAVWPHVHAGERIARSRRSVAALRRDVDDWLALHRADGRFARFATHHDVLANVLATMLDAVAADLDAAPAAGPDAGPDAGAVYERCEASDARVALVRRTFEWYAHKYDQRLDPRLEPVLLAADEIVRSCWSEPFTVTGRPRPTGPLVYLDPRFDATATPRISVPSDLRAPGDAVIGEFVRELPIPVVALPALSAAEPWWLVLAAHETGHHVQRDLSPDLEARTRTALLAVGTEVPAAADVGVHWAGWALEAFADAFATFTVGTAAGWAVEELQHARPARLVTVPRPGTRYPPPAVRTALVGELARRAGAADPGPGAADVRAWLGALPGDAVPAAARSATEVLLGQVPRVAGALVALTVDGASLPHLCGWSPDRFRAGGDVDRWRQLLASPAPAVAGRSARAAARLAVAGGVAAYRAASDGSRAEPAVLAANLLEILPTCGPAGTLAGAPAPDVRPVADRLTARLRATTARTEE